MQLNRFWTEQRGAATVEYAVLIGLFAVALVTSVTAVGAWIQREWSSQATLYSIYYGSTDTGSGGSTSSGTGSGTTTGSGSGNGNGNGNGKNK